MGPASRMYKVEIVATVAALLVALAVGAYGVDRLSGLLGQRDTTGGGRSSQFEISTDDRVIIQVAPGDATVANEATSNQSAQAAGETVATAEPPVPPQTQAGSQEEGLASGPAAASPAEPELVASASAAPVTGPGRLPAPASLWPCSTQFRPGRLEAAEEVALLWSSVGGAASYGVEMQVLENGQWKPHVNKTGLTDVKVTVNQTGSPGRWRVWAVNGPGERGTISEWCTIPRVR